MTTIPLHLAIADALHQFGIAADGFDAMLAAIGNGYVPTARQVIAARRTLAETRTQLAQYEQLLRPD